eukprot:6780237-Pyramimonas_sp.AAC.1
MSTDCSTLQSARIVKMRGKDARPPEAHGVFRARLAGEVANDGPTGHRCKGCLGEVAHPRDAG